MIIGEVTIVEELQNEELETTIPQEEEVPPTPAYVPRPQWQVFAARIGLVVFIILLILYYCTMFFGGK